MEDDKPDVASSPADIKRFHISFSEWGLWNNCQHRWYLKVLKGHDSKDEGVNLIFGTAIHDTLEILKNVDLSARCTLEEAKLRFETSFRAEFTRITPLVPEEIIKYDVELMVKAGRNIIDHIDDIAQLRDWTVAANELALYEKFDRTDDIEISFKGFVDIILKGKAGPGGRQDVLWICDFKTCSWGWAFTKRRDPAVLNQLFLYKHFVCKKYGLDPSNVRVAFILLKKNPSPKTPDDVVEWLPISAGPKSLSDAVGSLQSTITGMKSGVYVKNRESCRNKWGGVCPFLDTEHCTDP